MLKTIQDTLKIAPKHFYQYAILCVLIILCITSISALRNMRSNLTEEIVIEKNNLESNFNLQIHSGPEDSSVILKFDQSQAKEAELIIRLPKAIRAGVVELKLDETSALWKNKIQIKPINSGQKNGKPAYLSFNLKSNTWIPLRPNNSTYTIPLYRDTIKPHIILRIKYTDDLPELPIKSITLKPITFTDSIAGTLSVCLAIALITFLPGLLLIIAKPKLSFVPLPLSAFIYSTAINLVALGVCKLTGLHYLFSPSLLAITLTCFLLLKKKQNIKNNFQSLLNSNVAELNVWIGLIIIFSLFLSFNYPAATKNIHQGHITTQHTYEAFQAHDAVFQFYNGHAIIENDFNKYYGGGKLVYEPQDREILPGLSYAAVILFLKNTMGDELSKSYLPYAAFFLFCHILLPCMVFSWLKPLDEKLAYTGAIFILIAPAIWTTFMIGWFKATGAALILAGVFVIKNSPAKLSRWILAGVLFGLAKNYHGGNALVLPILTLWMLYLTYKSVPGISLKKLFISFITVTATTCAFIYPWNWYVKHIWHKSTHKLFCTFFSGGHYDPDSLLNSFVLLFKNVPLSEQLPLRFERTSSLFSYDWFMEYLAEYTMLAENFTSGWLKFSASYLFPAIAPYLLIAFVILVYSKFSHHRTPVSELLLKDKWFGQFGLMCLLNVVFITFLSYRSLDRTVGITWEVPTLLIVGMLMQLLVWTFRYHKSTLLFWQYLIAFQVGLLIAYG